jgi:hypothetical protein
MFFSSKQDYTLTSRAETTQHITTDVLTNLAFLSIVYCMACVVAYRNRGNEQLRGLLKWMATFAAYLYVGACVFPYLEQYAEINERRRVRHLLRAVRANLTESVFDEIADAIAGPDWESKTTGSLSWTFDGAVFFSFTLMTTIGYGSFVPQTRDGRLFTICYAPIGIAIAALTYVRLAETLLSLVEDLAFALMRVDPLKLAFDDCDVDHSGALSREEMAAMLTDLGAELSLAQFKELMASAQRHGPEKSRHGPGLAPPGSSPGLTVGATPPGELAELISYEGFAHALTLRPDLKKRVLNRSLRAYRWVFCFGTFGLMLALCATVGMWQEGWSLVDSFYFAVITFTVIAGARRRARGDALGRRARAVGVAAGRDSGSAGRRSAPRAVPRCVAEAARHRARSAAVRESRAGSSAQLLTRLASSTPSLAPRARAPVRPRARLCPCPRRPSASATSRRRSATLRRGASGFTSSRWG